MDDVENITCLSIIVFSYQENKHEGRKRRKEEDTSFPILGNFGDCPHHCDRGTHPKQHPLFWFVTTTREEIEVYYYFFRNKNISSMEQLRLWQTNQQSIQAVANALRQEKSSILTYFPNFRLENEQVLTYRRAAQQLGSMLSCLNRVLFLMKQQQILSSVKELYEMVGIPLADINRKWRDNHERLLREHERYNRYYDGLVQIQNTV